MAPGDLLPGPRVLLGPGPAMADPRVLRALSTPLVGQFDPELTEIMNEAMDLTRLVFRTANARVFPVSGTGRAGLEAALDDVLRCEGHRAAGAGVDAALADFAAAGAGTHDVSESLGADGIGRL